MMKQDDYKITVLEGLAAVRKIPSMFIGNLHNNEALHHMVMEILDNSVDEYLAGYCDKITVTLHEDGSASVGDTGRGIPIYRMVKEKMSALEVILTSLHAGGKFDKTNYKVSGGLHGLGASVVNALSSRLKVVVRRDGKEYSMAFAKGKKVEDLTEKKARGKATGTFIRFGPDLTIFKNITKFDPMIIKNKLMELSFLCRGLTIEFVDEIRKTKEIFGGESDMSGFIRHLSKGDLLAPPITFAKSVINKNDGEVTVDVALQWMGNTVDKEICKYYTNNIPNPEGGSHMSGFKAGLTRTINNFIAASDLPKSLKISLSGEDIREGLAAVVSIRHPDPKFDSQVKHKLVSEDARQPVENVVSSCLLSFLEQNPSIAKKIVSRCVNAWKAREAAKKAREAVRKSVMSSGAGVLPGKLADCQEKDPDLCELFIVEGSSAGGCFSGDTKVLLTDGRELSFKELIVEHKQGVQNYCYSINSKRKICIKPIINPRKTDTNQEVIEVTLDNGHKIICTPDHLFMLIDGSYKEIQYLSEGDSIFPLYKKLSKCENRITIKGYEMVWENIENRWVFTHVLADKYNIDIKKYGEVFGKHRHHLDFNKLNNNPSNIIRMLKDDHLELHRKMADLNLRTPEVLEKLRILRQTPEFRKKMSDIMSTPEMSKMLSERAKKQWEDEDYKKYMREKWLEFYYSNEEYRKQNNQQLREAAEKYWQNDEHRKEMSESKLKYFKEHPEAVEHHRQKAKEQWANDELLNWRREKTKEQWTDEFRRKRKKALKATYYRKTIDFMRKVYDEHNSIDLFDKKRIEHKDKSVLSKRTFLERYFDGNESDMMDALKCHNHKITKIVKLKGKTDVYDLEVPDTHNFALASGIFVHNSAKQGRDRRFQAILPLRGKVLNIEKKEFKALMDNEELTNLITAIGIGIGKSLNLAALRYGKIILCMDSDVDGSHIRTLLLTFFFRQMPQLIVNGNIYIACPPLYKVNMRGKSYYLKGDRELKIFSKKYNLENKSINMQRFKGLGELSGLQLWETTMNPELRTLLKVTINNYVEADKIFNVLMGSNIKARKEFIYQNFNKTGRLDI